MSRRLNGSLKYVNLYNYCIKFQLDMHYVYLTDQFINSIFASKITVNVFIKNKMKNFLNFNAFMMLGEE